MRVLILLLCLFLIPCALSAQDSSLCEGQQYDVDGDNVVGVGDVLSVLSWFGTVLDADQDGTLDCNDDCVGVYDECGVCNGPGPQVQVLDTIIITYDSIYVEAINDWVTYELGADSVFTLQCEDPGNFNACGDPIAMDGYSYSTVLIGDQCWFAENLRTTVYGNGDVIPAGLTDGEWDSTTSGATAVYGEGSSIATTTVLTSMPATRRSPCRSMAGFTIGMRWTMRGACVRADGMCRPMESGRIWRTTSVHKASAELREQL